MTVNRERILKTLVPLVFSLFILNTLALVFHWYSSVWYFDMPMHFLGGMWVGFLAIYLFLSFLQEKSPVKSIVTIMVFVLFIGIGWEIFEILIDKLLTFNLLNLLDSISDIFFDLAGGLSAVLYSIIIKQCKIQPK